MEKELKSKIRLLEAQKMTAQVKADKYDKMYRFYAHLPLIVFLFIFSLFLAWGLIDMWTHQMEVTVEEEVKILYGIWQLETKFHVYASWAFIGAAIGFFVYFMLKTVVATKITTVEYLKIIILNEQIKEKKELVKKLPPNPDN